MGKPHQPIQREGSGTAWQPQNFGMDGLPPHDERYDRAEEYVDLVNQLWDSWEPDAILADKRTGIYADPAKVHEVVHHGRWRP